MILFKIFLFTQLQSFFILRFSLHIHFRNPDMHAHIIMISYPKLLMKFLWLALLVMAPNIW